MAETTPNFAALGMDLEQSLSQLKKGKLTYALNAMIEGFDGQFVNYQNESGNELCVTFPDGFKVINTYTIYEKNLILYFLANPTTGGSEIGKSYIDECIYTKVIGGDCLNFKVDKPILAAAHQIDNCHTKVFFVDGHNLDRFIDLEELPYQEIETEGCDNIITDQLDCNKMAINPNFSIPKVVIEAVEGDGTLTSGTYQFGIQYANSNGDPYTATYSITNPLPIFDVNNITLNFDSVVNKSITVNITELESTGFYDYFNLVLVKTVNNISSAELVGTYLIVKPEEQIIYTGQKKIDLSLADVMQKYPVYLTSRKMTAVGGTLVRADLTQTQRLSYQQIASGITTQWQSWKVTQDKNYTNAITSTNLRGYMRDEVYALDLVLLLTKGRETDKFSIPGRMAVATDLEMVSNDDVVNLSDGKCEPVESQPRWKVYNTGTLLGNEPEYVDTDTCYTGPYQYGEMAYWESAEEYPCDVARWGNLAGQKIRHHKFPDCLISKIHDAEGNIYPIGIKISHEQIRDLVRNSSLTQEQKDEIIGYKIVRSNRANNKSVIAKGLIHNVGVYTKDKATYFYPNYPYNPVGEDKFISGSVNAIPADVYRDQTPVTGGCFAWRLDPMTNCNLVVSYQDCNGVIKSISLSDCETVMEICSVSQPTVISGNPLQISITALADSTPCNPTPPITPVPDDTYLNGFAYGVSKERFVFHSPDTHFYQPFLGNILKLETAEYGVSKGHFVQTKEHAKYKLFTAGLYITALGVSGLIGAASGMYGLSNRPFDGIAFMTAYQTLTTIFERVTPKVNYAYHYTSVGKYNNSVDILNSGNKQRELNIATYLLPGIASVGDTNDVNNFQRESSVYLKTNKTLPYTHEAGTPVDVSRWLPDTTEEKDDFKNTDISSYYAAIKKPFVNQYGQIDSYESIDTGTQIKLSDTVSSVSIFGGDVFINRFGYKSKFPYFIDNRVKSLDESDVFYNEIGNIGTPTYWFSMDSSASKGTGIFSGFDFFGLPTAKLQFQENKWSYRKGRMYLFSYGIPYFFCESEVNVDMRQAFNNKEGDFYPRVSSGIPDEWLQEANVSINYDNTYYYNKTYSKQNKETFFSNLPADYDINCETIYPFKAVFSEPLRNNNDVVNNNWFIYKPASVYDFSQSYGPIASIDTLTFEQVLVRFENRSQIYNAMLTAPTSQADLYLGQSLFSQQVPPVDLAVTDQGFAGSRHRFLLKTEYGMIWGDDKRGHIFLLNGRQPQNLTDMNSGVEQFFNKNLEVKLPKYIAGVPIDNAANGVGIHGVYDAKYNRFILTKLDYEPLVAGITYSNGKFYSGATEIELSNTNYFCNRSFTISYDFEAQSWISFHTYLPNYYVGSSNFFLSGYADKSWKHHIEDTFCSFYNEQAPYTIEYPFAFQYQDEILQAVADYSKTLQYVDGYQIEVNDIYFNKCILYNNQQCSGILNLAMKPRNNMADYMKYPIYSTDSKTILYTKSDNFYKINQFWSLVKDPKKPIFKKSCQALSFDKEINQENMNYSKMAFKKAPLRAKDLKCRFTLDNRTDTRIVSQLTTIQTQKSFK